MKPITSDDHHEDGEDLLDVGVGGYVSEAYGGHGGDGVVER